MTSPFPTGPFDPARFYPIKDQVGPGKMFGSATARDTAIAKGFLHPGFLVGGRWVNTGEQLNESLLRHPNKKETAEGFGGRQPGAGRPSKSVAA
jgi:hypothetical protein